MKFLIKDFYDSEGRRPVEYSDHLLSIDGDFLVIKVGSKYTGKFTELYRKSLVGWHNIFFSRDKYVMDSGKYINIETDILTRDDGKYKHEQYSIAFIPLQTYSLDKFFNFLSELNKNNLEEGPTKISERLKKEQEQILKAKKEKEKIERQALVNDFTNKVHRLRKNREIEKVFLNYFSKYVNNLLLSPGYHMAFAYDMLKDNHLFKQVVGSIPILSISTRDLVKPDNFKLEEVDKLVEFVSRVMGETCKDCAKLLTWIEISDVAVTYYSSCFYDLYGKQIDDIDGLCLRDSILRYVRSDILNDDKNTRGMFVYFLMSLGNFDGEDFHKGYIQCQKVFMDIYKELKSESEYDRFISSLSVKEQPDEVSYSIDDVDLMTGSEFEKFTAELFKKMGFKTIITKASGDQGIDVIAEKGGVRYGIQSKCHSTAISNSAIQEVVAGLTFHKCDKGMVITNNHFTNSAVELAKANEVILWDREMLKQKIMDLY